MPSPPAAADASSSSITTTTTPPTSDSVTALDYINSQLQLESEAREALPYSFDACTRPLGVLRQSLYACKTCTSRTPSTPPPFGWLNDHAGGGGAALCYSCSISCHGDHELVEIFEKRGFRCDCGTLRVPGVACKIRKEIDAEAEDERLYGQNFWGRFCICEAVYEPEKEDGVMHQCLLGDVCQEDWFHDTCMVGREPPAYVKEQKKKEKEEAELSGEESVNGTKDMNGKLPAGTGEEAATTSVAEKEKDSTHTKGFATVADENREEDEEEEEEDDDDRAKRLGFPEDYANVICWKCLEANPWLKQLASYPKFFALERKGAVSEQEATTTVAIGCSPPKTEASQPEPQHGHKRKASDPSEEGSSSSSTKRARAEDLKVETTVTCTLPSPSPLPTVFSLLLPKAFRKALCHCPSCFQHLRAFPILREKEEAHEPQVSRSASPTGSIFEEGERALNGMDRVRAIEGVLAYNQLKDRVKAFLEPFAKSGKVVGAEDVAAYFEGLKEERK
ncbi:hypothetical protein BZA05DRAFT_476742 [Tricharina praecox]|uniref:uncharacterized protein n=1 Tax=Tricharina praecox TaxID=43433 RepID=UPI0022205658|nr:uncharacterized protein BZA05DRAFT_476742 [Tricharina praecox]KAI5844720.1 hypothetical protein BZA05DRAFT_476742 [Tricharina praecox]